MYHEATDLLIEHGLNVGRKNSGRHGLPLRLGTRLADPIGGGALSKRDHADLVEVAARRIVL